MAGISQLRINKAKMMEAVSFYLNQHVFVEPMTITNIVFDNTYGQSEAFIIYLVL